MTGRLTHDLHNPWVEVIPTESVFRKHGIEIDGLDHRGALLRIWVVIGDGGRARKNGRDRGADPCRPQRQADGACPNATPCNVVAGTAHGASSHPIMEKLIRGRVGLPLRSNGDAIPGVFRKTSR
jgi:hypothetical protein